MFAIPKPEELPIDYDGIFDLLVNTPGGNHAGLMVFNDHSRFKDGASTMAMAATR